MRQKTPFPPARRQPEPVPAPQPSRLGLLRGRFGRFYVRFHNIFLLGMGVLLALVAMFMFDATKAPPQRLSQRDIDAAVARAMASATPAPSHAAVAYAIIH